MFSINISPLRIGLQVSGKDADMGCSARCAPCVPGDRRWGAARTAVLALGCTLALAACSKSEDKPQSAEDVQEEIENMVKPMPGLYRTETKLISVNVPGASEEDLKQLRSENENISQSCMTPRESEKGYQDLLQVLGEGDNGMKCTFSKFKIEGEELDAKMACDGIPAVETAISMTGEVAADHTDIEMDMAMTISSVGDMGMKLNVSSKRIGPCVAAQPESKPAKE